jgi:hypothetical protein
VEPAPQGEFVAGPVIGLCIFLVRRNPMQHSTSLMPQFITRVELHGAKGEEYSRLHAAMKGRGFLREITADNGITYMLPTAEYNRIGNNLTVKSVYDDAWGAASSVWARCAVLVVQADGPKMWNGLDAA